MSDESFQSYYPESTQHCYGCGTLNPKGLHIESFWEGEDTVCRFTPEPYHTAVPGYVYGGLIASLIDCHSTGSATAAAYRDSGRELGSDPPLRFVTGSLHVDYLKPTPLGVPLVVRGTIHEIRGRVVVVRSSLSAESITCATGEVVAVRMPDDWLESLTRPPSG